MVPLVLAIGAAVPVRGAPTRGLETRVPCTSLPTVVLGGARSEAAGALIRRSVKDSEEGGTTYEVESMRDNKGRDITFAVRGSLMEVEQDVSPENLPRAVSDAIQRPGRGGKGKVGKVESVTRAGVIAEYEATIMRKGVRREVAFSPNGARRAAD